MNIKLSCGCQVSTSNDHILELFETCGKYRTMGREHFTMDDLRIVARAILRNQTKNPKKLLGRWGGGADEWGNE